MCGYSMLAQSVLKFVRQCVAPDGDVARADEAAVAMLTGAPMHSRGPGIAEHLSTIGAAKELGSIALLARASEITLVATSPEVDKCLEEIR